MHDYLGKAARTVVMYFYVLLVTRVMGKREIGQLSPFDLVVAIMIADLASLPLEERYLTLLDGLVPIAVLAAAEIGISLVSLKNENARRFISGTPTVVVRDGKIVDANLRRLRYNVSDLMSQLREKDVSSLADVEYAILETSGKLSVIVKPTKRPVTPSDLGIQPAAEKPAVVLIADGKVNYDNLEALGLNLLWLKQQVQSQGCARLEDVVYASLCPDGSVYVSARGQAAGVEARPGRQRARPEP